MSRKEECKLDDLTTIAVDQYLQEGVQGVLRTRPGRSFKFKRFVERLLSD